MSFPKSGVGPSIYFVVFEFKRFDVRYSDCRDIGEALTGRRFRLNRRASA